MRNGYSTTILANEAGRSLN